MADDQLVIEHGGQKYYSAEAAAAFLGKSRAWLYNMINKRGIQRYAFDMYGKVRFIRESDLIAIRDSGPRPVDDPKANAA